MANTVTLAELQERWSEIQKEFSLKTPTDFPLSWNDKQFLSSLRKSKEPIHLRGCGKSFFGNLYPGLTEEKLSKKIWEVINEVEDIKKLGPLPTKEEIKIYIDSL